MKETKIKSGFLSRDATVDSIRTVEVRDGETREIEFSVSSEVPVERWFGMEILSHKPEAIRLNRLANGGPLLLNHNTDDQIGAFKRGSVRVEGGKVRGVARFSRSARAQEIAADVEDDIRTSTSIGYRVYRMERDPTRETVDPETGEVERKFYVATDWEPLEASIVPVPADPSVGKGRMLERENDIVVVEPDAEDPPGESKDDGKEVDSMEKKEEVTPNPEPVKVDDSKVRDESAKVERARIAEIRATQVKFGLKDDFVEKHINEGTPIQDFRADVIRNWNPKNVQTIDPNIGLSKKEAASFSLTKAIRAQVTGDWSKAGLERQATQAAAEKAQASGIDIREGVMVPWDVTFRANEITATIGEGPEFVGTDLLGASFIDVLRNRLATMAAGATTLTGLVGNVAIPRQTTASAGTMSATEITGFTQALPAFDQVTLSAKVGNAWIPVSRQLLMQGSPDVEGVLRRDLVLGLTTLMDSQALYGAGSGGECTGIANLGGVGGVDFGEVAPTWAKVVEAESDVATANADFGSLAWILHPKTRAKFKTTEKKADAGEGYLWDTRVPETPLNAYPVFITNQVDDATGTGSAFSTGFFGNWNELFYGLWGGISVMADPYTSATTNIVRLIASVYFDIGVRHDASFTYCIGLQN